MANKFPNYFLNLFFFLQRKILEEKQRQKRMYSAGIRQNDAMKDSRFGTSKSANKELHGYDGPLSFGITNMEDPDQITSPVFHGRTIITVRGVTPPPAQWYYLKKFLFSFFAMSIIHVKLTKIIKRYTKKEYDFFCYIPKFIEGLANLYYKNILK